MYLYRLASSICRSRCLCLPWRSLRSMQQQQRYLRTRPTRARLPRRASEADVAESQSPADDLVAYDDIVFTDKSAYVPFGGRLPAPRLQPAPSPAEDPLIKDRRYAKVVEQPPAPTLRAPPPPAPASAPPPPSVDPGVLSSETLNTYTIALPPSRDQLAQANKFFARTEPTLLYTAGKFHECPASPFPEVAFLGRSNVGKSSLFNALLNRSASAPAHVSSRPGKTKTMNGFGVGGPGLVGAAPTAPRSTVEGELVPARRRDEVWKRLGTGGLVIVDMPGYGGGSREEWGKAALMFLKERKQLRRAFLLIDAEHGPKATDLELLRYLQTEGISWQVVLSKVDKALMKHGKAPKSPEGMGRRLAELRQAKEKYTAMIQEVLAGGGRRQEPSPAATPKPLDDLSVLEAPKKRKKGPRMVGMDVLCCSSEKSIEGAHRKIGIDELRWAIMTACGIEAVD